ncbi:MAG: hypothetical protein WBH14_11130 [Albidovulum sp.]
MAEVIPVALDFSKDLLMALGHAAETAGCSPEAYLRAVLHTALDRSPARIRPEDEVIRRALHLSQTWIELQQRLRKAGYVLRCAPEGGLAIHSWPLNQPIVRLDALGLSQAALVLKFQAGFPGDVGQPARPYSKSEYSRRGQVA